MNTTHADPNDVLISLHARIWDRMALRGHELADGPWEVFTCDPKRRHQWHVLCSKRCRFCGAQAMIERRVISANIHLRPMLPPGRCSSAQAPRSIR